MDRRLKVYGKAAVVLAMVASPLALYATPATANHESTTIRVGVDNTGQEDRDFFDDSNLSVLTGTPVDYSFDFGSHNVRFTTANPGGLPDSPNVVEPLGTTLDVLPNVAGTYIYFCSLHSNQADALAETNWNDPGKMHGRIVVTADTTAPVWDPGVASATANSASQITIDWPTATDNSGSVFFDVYQSDTLVQPGTPIADNVTGTSYIDSGLAAGVTYNYWIVAVDGAGNEASPPLTASATTSSVAASSTASAVVQFGVDPTLSITVSPSVLDLGTLSPAAAGTGTATVTIGSNDTWSLNVKAIGRDAVDEAFGDDAVFTDDGGKTIPVDRATWEVGGGATPLSDVDAVAVTGMAAAAAFDVPFAYSVQPLFTDPAGVNYRTTVLYTVTQP